MKYLQLLIAALSLPILSLAQTDNSYDPGELKNKTIEWNKAHFRSTVPTKKQKSFLKRRNNENQIDRVRHGCHDEKFLLGANVAWNKFQYDLSLANYDPIYFENMFADVEAQGGNSLRFWLHTNGAKNPEFTDVSDPLKCTGIAASDTTNLKDFLDRAWNHGIAIQICLWTHNMLSTKQVEVTQAVRDRNRAILENPVYTQHYIDNALIPVLKATADHPALLAYEVFNEAEGMSFGVPHNPTLGNWADFEHTNFQNIQQTINLIAGAIHREVPNALVTNGALDMESTTDVDGHVNYYRDDSLYNRGGDLDGFLDFYTVHYYQWGGEDNSPFHHNVNYWQLDKPLVIAEFYAEETFGVPADSLFKRLYDYGYAGAWGWQYFYNNVTDLWGNMKPGMKIAHDNYAADIDWDTKNCKELNAVFKVDKKTTCTGLDLVFTDFSTNEPTDWLWDFGADATPQTASTAGPHSVSYSSAGEKTISLTVNKGANSDVNTLLNYVTICQGHEISLSASDHQLCDGTNILFSTDVTPSLSSIPVVESVPLGGFGENITTIQSYTIGGDGSTSPSMSNLSRYLHGTTKPTFGTFVEFTGSFSNTSQASIFSKASAGAQSVEIQIDGVSQGTFAINGVQNHSVSVPEGVHTIKFIGVGNDWISVEKYVFTDVQEQINYQWYLNGDLLPTETSNTYESTSLSHGDHLLAKASSDGFNCSVPEISSNTITMNCLATSLQDLAQGNSFRVFPNPSVDNFVIQSDQNFEARVYDSAGKLVDVITVNANTSQTFGSDLQQGIYLIIDTSSAKSMKLIKR